MNAHLMFSASPKPTASAMCSTGSAVVSIASSSQTVSCCFYAAWMSLNASSTAYWKLRTPTAIGYSARRGNRPKDWPTDA